ncbi:MAG TPA: DUF6431 domain-containing protein [Bacilli bacterium]
MYKDQGPQLNMCCEDCGHTLHKHGRYYRWVINKSEMIYIPIYRWLCPSCRTTLSLLPDFLVPWARFTTWVREAAMVRKRQGRSWHQIAATITLPQIGVSSSTVKRWWKHYVKKAAPVALWMAAQLVAAGCEHDLLRQHPRPVNPTPSDTVIWLKQLQEGYTSQDSRIRGYWSFLNARLPGKSLF